MLNYMMNNMVNNITDGMVNNLQVHLEKYWLVYLLLVNILAFLVYGLDKYKAIKNQWRISEATLITLAIIGGGLGAFVGMKFFHHKTQKPKFYIGVPVIAVMWIVLAVLAFCITCNQ